MQKNNYERMVGRTNLSTRHILDSPSYELSHMVSRNGGIMLSGGCAGVWLELNEIKALAEE